jgi:hypothetical protein
MECSNREKKGEWNAPILLRMGELMLKLGVEEGNGTVPASGFVGLKL